MRKNNQERHSSLVVRVNKDCVKALGQGVGLKSFRQSPQHPSTNGDTTLRLLRNGKANGTAQSASTLGDLKTTRKWQSCCIQVNGSYVSALQGSAYIESAGRSAYTTKA